MEKRRSRKKSIYDNNFPNMKKLRLKDCKLLELLLIFIRVQNKVIEKNQKIILKYVFNKENLLLLDEKLK